MDHFCCDDVLGLEMNTGGRGCWRRRGLVTTAVWEGDLPLLWLLAGTAAARKEVPLLPAARSGCARRATSLHRAAGSGLPTCCLP